MLPRKRTAEEMLQENQQEDFCILIRWERRELASELLYLTTLLVGYACSIRITPFREYNKIGFYTPAR